MNDTLYVITVFLAMGAVTFAERALPFVASRWLKNQAWVRDVGSFLPLAVMVLLVLSSGAGFAAGHTGLPWQETVSVLLTVLVQWFFRNSLVSIFAGTALYVVLRNNLLAGLF